MSTHERFLLVAVLVILVVAVTMGPHLMSVYDVVSDPLTSAVGGRAAEFLLNAALFLPLGLLAGSTRSSRGFAAVLLLAVGVETVQWFLPRDADLFDLGAYVVGATTGAASGTLLRAVGD